MPKDFPRQTRIADLIQRDLAQLMQKEISDPRLQMVTFSTVRVSVDYSLATVYFTVMGDEPAAVEETLNQAAGYMRRLLSKRLMLRRVPRLRFVYDESLIAGNRIARLIDEVSLPE